MTSGRISCRTMRAASLVLMLASRALSWSFPFRSRRPMTFVIEPLATNLESLSDRRTAVESRPMGMEAMPELSRKKNREKEKAQVVGTNQTGTNDNNPTETITAIEEVSKPSSVGADLLEGLYTGQFYRQLRWYHPEKWPNSLKHRAKSSRVIEMPLYPLDMVYLQPTDIEDDSTFDTRHFSFYNFKPRTKKLVLDLMKYAHKAGEAKIQKQDNFDGVIELNSNLAKFCTVLRAADTGSMASDGTFLRIVNASIEYDTFVTAERKVDFFDQSAIRSMKMVCQTVGAARVYDIINPRAADIDYNILYPMKYLMAKVGTRQASSSPVENKVGILTPIKSLLAKVRRKQTDERGQQMEGDRKVSDRVKEFWMKVRRKQMDEQSPRVDDTKDDDDYTSKGNDENDDRIRQLAQRIVDDYKYITRMYRRDVREKDMPGDFLYRMSCRFPKINMPEEINDDFLWYLAHVWQGVCHTMKYGRDLARNRKCDEKLDAVAKDVAARSGEPITYPVKDEDVDDETREQIEKIDNKAGQNFRKTGLDPCLDFAVLAALSNRLERWQWVAYLVRRERARLVEMTSKRARPKEAAKESENNVSKTKQTEVFDAGIIKNDEDEVEPFQ